MSLPASVTIRPLLPEEFYLASGPEGVVWPAGAIILGAFQDDKLVGRLGVLLLPHIEGLWVDETCRGSGDIARELHRQVEDASAAIGRNAVFAYVPSTHPGMGAHLVRAGYEKLDFSIYAKKLGE